jgi:predicted DsbA family dithiol-disulfide isomerase
VPPATDEIIAEPIRLEIFFDLSCPFCLLAKVTIDELVRSSSTPIAISWSPLILHPSLPPEGVDFQSAHVGRYGERARELRRSVEQRAASLGLKIDHARISKVPNTLDAHRTVRFAAESGRAADMIDAILRAYLTQGRDITDHETLLELAQSTGLDVNALRTRLPTDWLRADVLAASETSSRRGARSVPSYCLNDVHFENTTDAIPELRRLLAGADVNIPPTLS